VNCYAARGIEPREPEETTMAMNPFGFRGSAMKQLAAREYKV